MWSPKSSSGIIGCVLRDSATTNATAATTPTTAAQGAAWFPHSIRAYVVPANATTARRPPGMSNCPTSSGFLVSGTHFWAARMVAAAIGMLIRKIQRHVA